jgi:predicted Zn-dependent protease
VLSHEVVHAAARHGANQMSRALLLQLGTGAIQLATNGDDYSALAGYGVAAFQARYSRSQELEADKYGMDYMVNTGYEPMAAVELQQTFVKLSTVKSSNLKTPQSSAEQSDWLNALFASHPPSQARVAANRAKANHFPQGKRNQRAYRRAIRQIIDDEAAYQAHREAIAAAGKEQWQQALNLTDKAIAAQPKEALFWITRARLQEKNTRHKNALQSYSKAIRLNDNYFAGYLHRGLLHHKMRRYNDAKSDLLASNRLLETQPANFHLGEIALSNGQEQAAIDYYQKAAGGGGDLGQLALRRLKALGI